MRIKFDIAEIYDWIEALEDNFCIDSEDAIEKYNMIMKKLKNAEIRSHASIGKIKYIENAEIRKQREHDKTVREYFLISLRESRKKREMRTR